MKPFGFHHPSSCNPDRSKKLRVDFPQTSFLSAADAPLPPKYYYEEIQKNVRTADSDYLHSIPADVSRKFVKDLIKNYDGKVHSKMEQFSIQIGDEFFVDLVKSLIDTCYVDDNGIKFPHDLIFKNISRKFNEIGIDADELRAKYFHLVKKKRFSSLSNKRR